MIIKFNVAENQIELTPGGPICRTLPIGGIGVSDRLNNLRRRFIPLFGDAAVLLIVTFTLTQQPTVSIAEEGKPSPDMDAAKASGRQATERGLEQLRRVKLEACKSGIKLDPFEIWKNVTGPDEARPFLRTHYARIGTIEGMKEWFECQGFNVRVMNGPLSDVKNAEKKLSAGFVFKEHGGRRLWGWFL